MSRRLVVALFRGTGVISSAIEWFTRGTASHMATLIIDGPNILQIEAWSDGVNIRGHFDPHGAKQVDFYEVDATEAQIDCVLANARKEVGCKYDYRDIWYFVIRGKPPAGASPTKWICSELGYYLLTSAQLRIFALPANQAYEVSPEIFRWSLALNPIPNPIPS